LEYELEFQNEILEEVMMPALLEMFQSLWWDYQALYINNCTIK